MRCDLQILSQSTLECLCKLLGMQAVALQATDVIFTGMLKLPSGQRIEDAGCALAAVRSSCLAESRSVSGQGCLIRAHGLPMPASRAVPLR